MCLIPAEPVRTDGRGKTNGKLEKTPRLCVAAMCRCLFVCLFVQETRHALYIIFINNRSLTVGPSVCMPAILTLGRWRQEVQVHPQLSSGKFEDNLVNMRQQTEGEGGTETTAKEVAETLNQER